MSGKPTLTIEFETKLRNAYVYVEASAWHDFEGIYKVHVDDVSLHGVSVLDILSDDDISDIEMQIEPEIIAQSKE